MSDSKRPSEFEHQSKKPKPEEATPEMKLFLEYEGKWESKIKMWFPSPPDGALKEKEGKGSIIYEALNGGKALEGKHQMLDEKGHVHMEGTEILGYDPKSQEWHSYWIDSYSTNPIVTRGKMENGIVTMTGKMDNKMTGESGVPVKTVYDFMNHTFQMFMQKDENDKDITVPMLHVTNNAVQGTSTVSHITVRTKNVDETKAFYIEKLGFDEESDIKFGEDPCHRWCVIRAPEDNKVKLTLSHCPSDKEKLEAVGNQTPGVPFLILNTRDVDRDLANFEKRGGVVARGLKDQFYGREAIIKDNNGNEICFLRPKCH
jgi:predicted enzyme related to lactoylglutathione lyase